MSNQRIFLFSPADKMTMHAELVKGDVQAGPKRDIHIYEYEAAPITKSWIDYAGATRFTYTFKKGQVPIPMKLVTMLKVASTGYLVPVFEVRGVRVQLL